MLCIIYICHPSVADAILGSILKYSQLWYMMRPKLDACQGCLSGKMLPNETACDSLDWNTARVTDMFPQTLVRIGICTFKKQVLPHSYHMWYPIFTTDTLHFWICLKNIQDSVIIWHKHNKNGFNQKTKTQWWYKPETNLNAMVCVYRNVLSGPSWSSGILEACDALSCSECFSASLCSGVRPHSPCAIHFSGCVESLKYLAFSNSHSVLADWAGLGPRWWWWVIGSSCWSKWNIFYKISSMNDPFYICLLS